MKCDVCDYEWKSKKEKPISCPRCKRRFDYPIDLDKKKGDTSELLSKESECDKDY
jgi:hypothetical protein